MRALILGGVPGLCERALALGAEVVLVETPDRVDAALMRRVARAVVTRFDDPALPALAAALHAQAPFDAVLSLTEFGLLPAAIIGAHLGLSRGCPPDVVARTRDKFAMREHLARAGVPSAQAIIASDADDIRGLAARIGWPVVAKPRDGFASRDAVLLADAGALDGFAVPPGTLVEEYLDGPELSVEAFSIGGRHAVVAINAETKNADGPNVLLEIAHALPAALPAARSAEIVAYVRSFLDAIGLTDGPTHTELKLTARGPRVIETHNRLAGDSIPALVQLATGIDLMELTVRHALGMPVAPPSPTATGAAAIRYFTPPPGRVASISGVERWTDHPGIHRIALPLRPGDLVRPYLSSADRVGHVIAVAADAEVAASLCRAACDDIRIDLLPDNAPAT